MYALIEYAGKQYRIEEGLTLKFPYISAKEGTKITIDKVLLLDSGKEKMFGSPYVDGVHYSPSANKTIASKIYNIIKEKIDE